MCKAPNWTISGLTISMCFKTIQLVGVNSLVQCGAAFVNWTFLTIVSLPAQHHFLVNVFMVAKGYGQQNLMDFPNGEEGGVVSLSVVGHLTSHKVMEASTWLSPQIWENWFHSREL